MATFAVWRADRIGVATALLALACAGTVMAQAPAAPTGTSSVIARTGIPQRDTLLKVTGQKITADFQEKRLEDVITFIRDFSGADLEPLWTDAQNDQGLEKERIVSVKVENVSVLALIEKVLEKCGDGSTQATWQMTASGSMQLSTKARLNKDKRLEIYDFSDLITEVPDFRDGPKIDLQQALQASQRGGGGGQSPFRDNTNDNVQRESNRKARLDELTRLIKDVVEPEQWLDNGGTGGSMQIHGNAVIINAPDYMHRALDGYKYWPQSATRVSMVDGRRYVALTADSAISTLQGFAQQPVSATAGGSSQGGKGGGGN